MKTAAAVALASVLSVFSPARRDAKKGAEAYRDKKFPDAARRFGEAAKRDPSDPAWTFDLGTALGAAGKPGDARGPLGAAARSGERKLAADALYQQGTLDLGAGDYRSAADALRESLLRDPARPDAQRNYEIAWRKLQERKPPPPPSSGSPPPAPEKKKPPAPQPPGARSGNRDEEFERRAGMTRQEAEALLRSLDAEQRRREKTAPAAPGKDW
ncbi:MAG TPA: tetratricopeptide repeat protein [Thermoanaerobaculia bacterium]|jgi:tetratricopeptide (TPR) repeat protein|nr:tetratricopeptide repeat protein [Thermoanaerobaculia bacterium]